MAIALASCADYERDNPLDPKATGRLSSSSGAGVSSSSVQSSSSAEAKCGNRTEVYDTNLYECKPSINENGIYLKAKPKDADGNEYEAVLIGEQTWMAENLKYNVRDSKCYAEDVSGVSADSIAKNCDKYGRLYRREMINSNVCPNGWHIPENNEWENLSRHVDKNFINISNNTAGINLRAKEDWNTSGGPYKIGNDTHGFKALGGGGFLYDYFSSVQIVGYWWSGDWRNAFVIQISVEAAQFELHTDAMFSVRCVKD